MAPVADGEPPVPGTEEAAAAKAPKAAAKPSYSSAPVLNTPAAATPDTATPQVFILPLLVLAFTLCLTSA